MSVTLSDPKLRINPSQAVSSDAVHGTVTGVDAKGQMFRRPAEILKLDGRDCMFRTDCEPEGNGSVLLEYELRRPEVKRQVLHASVKSTVADGDAGFYKVIVELDVAQSAKIFATAIESQRAVETRSAPAKAAPGATPVSDAIKTELPSAKAGPALVSREAAPASQPPASPMSGVLQSLAHASNPPLTDVKSQSSQPMAKTLAENPISVRETVRTVVADELKQELAILKTWISGEMERAVPGIVAVNAEKMIRGVVEKQAAAAHEKSTQAINAKVSALVEERAAEIRTFLDSTSKKLAQDQAQLSRNAASSSDEELTARAASISRSLEDSAAELSNKLLTQQNEFSRAAAERAEKELNSRAAVIVRSLEESTVAMAGHIFEQQAELSRAAQSNAKQELNLHAATILRSLEESTSEMATQLIQERAEVLRTIHNDAHEDLTVRAAAIVRSLEESASGTVKRLFQEQADISLNAMKNAERDLDLRAATALRSIEASVSEMEARIAASAGAAEVLFTKSESLQREIKEGMAPLQQALQQLNEDNATRMESFRTQLDFELSRCSVQLENHFTNISNQKAAEFSAELEKRFAPAEQTAGQLLEKLGAVFQLLQNTARVQQERLTEHSKLTAVNFEKEIRAVLLRLAGG